MDFYCMYNFHTKYCDRIHYTPYRKNKTDSFYRQKKMMLSNVHYLSIYILITLGEKTPEKHHSYHKVCHVDKVV